MAAQEPEAAVLDEEQVGDVGVVSQERLAPAQVVGDAGGALDVAATIEVEVVGLRLRLMRAT